MIFKTETRSEYDSIFQDSRPNIFCMCQAKKASDQVKGKAKGINLPVSFVPPLSDRMNLQQDVGFFGGGKQAASKVCIH